MAIDTKAKRFSMLGMFNPMVNHVIPSGSVDAATRETFLHLYEGIALDSPSEAGLTVLDFMRGHARGFNVGGSRGHF